MKIPFYQTHWFDISLKEIHGSNKSVTSANFFQEFYNKLLSKNTFSIKNDWIEKKHNLSKWIYNYLKTHYCNNKYNALSIGCGLGIVEQPIIDSGIKLDLQECQTSSIEYLKHNHPETYKKTKFILSNDLKEISNNSYDVVMAMTSSYCLTNKQLSSFFQSTSRILKKNGLFIFYETPLSIYDLYNYVKIHIRKPEGILWGWKRSSKIFTKTAQNYDLHLINEFYFDGNNHEIKDCQIFGLSLNKNSSWQLIVFKKS